MGLYQYPQAQYESIIALALPNSGEDCKLSDSINLAVSVFAMSRRFSLPFGRQLWLQCHIYLALLFGLLFGVIGLSGSLCVYRDSLDVWLNPVLIVEQSPAPPLSLDKIMAKVRQAEPQRHGVWTLELPRSADEPLIAWFEKPRETVDKAYAPLMLAVNPYTGDILTKRFWGETFTTGLLDLHSRLQLENEGRPVLAILAVSLSVSVVSGLYLWWPGLAALRLALRVRPRGSLLRFLLDMHRLLGLASAGVLLLLAFTGFHLAYPELLESLTASQGMGHGDEGPTIRSTAVPNNHPVSIAEAILVARGLFPHSEVRRVSTPQGELGTYRINLRQKDELNQHHPFTTVWIDRWSGQIRGVNNPSQFSMGQTLTTWQWPLHTGEAFGTTGRLLWFIAGLMPMLLWISGVAHWLHRLGWIKDRSIDLPSDGWRLMHRFAESTQQTWIKSRPCLQRSWRWIKTHRPKP